MIKKYLVLAFALAATIAVGSYTGGMIIQDATIPSRTATVSAAGAVKVDNSAVTQPVSGTFFQATQPVSGTFWQTTQPVSASSLPLPSGASTSAKQDTGNTSLASIDSKLTSGVPVTGTVAVSNFPASQAVTGTFFQATQPVSGTFWQTTQPVSGTFFQATQPVSAAALPLPSGAATSANQTTANSSLSSIDGKITAVNTGAVVVSSSALPSGASTSSLQSTGNTSLSSIDTKTPALGQALAAASSPVVLTAAQLSTLTPLPTVAVTQSTSPWVSSVTGTVTANAGTNLNTSALALDATLSGTQVSQGSTTSGQKGVLSLGAVSTNAPTYSNGQTSPISLSTRGDVRTQIKGGDLSQLIRNDYSSVNVTTAAYVQLVASTASNINRLYIFDSSGQDFVLAVGAAASEVDQIRIPPGGLDTVVDLFIPSGSRISIKASSATASSGLLIVTGLK